MKYIYDSASSENAKLGACHLSHLLSTISTNGPSPYLQEHQLLDDRAINHSCISGINLGVQN